MTERQRADTVVATRTLVEHRVTFILGDEDRFVVPRRHVRGHLLAYAITVEFLPGGQIRTFANGTVCNKDGTFGQRRGRIAESFDLPIGSTWIQRARAHIDGDDGGHG